MGRFFQTRQRKSDGKLRLGDSMTPQLNVHWSLCSRSGVEETGAARITWCVDCGADPDRFAVANFSAAGMGTRLRRTKHESIPAPYFRLLSDLTRAGGCPGLGDTLCCALLRFHALRIGCAGDLDGRRQSLGDGLPCAPAGLAALCWEYATGRTRTVEPSMGHHCGRGS